jgi:hypothetical protein
VDEEEPQPVKMVVTCRTEGCPVEGVSYTVDMYPNKTEPFYRAQCGQCHNPITDIVPAA